MVGTALAIGMGISAATQLAGAKIASNASKKAAGQQTQAVDRAQGIVTNTLSPYVNKGREAISTLGRLTAAPAGSRYAAPDPTRPPAPQPPMAAPRPMTMGGLSPGGGEDLVTVQSPDGSSTRQMPRQQAQQYVSRGARIVA